MEPSDETCVFGILGIITGFAVFPRTGSKDVMTVWMFAFPPLNGGMEMTVDAVDARLESMGVNFGINRDLILQAVSKRMYFKLLPIAPAH